MPTERNLTDADVEAVVIRLKASILSDFQLNVGKGLMSWLWTWFWRLLVVAALYGLARGQFMPDKPAAKVGAHMMPTANAAFVVIPPAPNPMLNETAERLRILMNKELG